MKGELLRYARTCNNTQDFNKKVEFFTQKLQKRGYNTTETMQTKKEVEHINRES